MQPEYHHILESAKSKKKELKKFLDKLKQKAPHDLDQVVSEMHEEVFAEIDCLQCGNCCRTTGPLLKSKDVERMANHQRLRPAEFTEKFLRIDEDNDYVFKSMPCPFLREDNYCAAYEARPNACREFPHTNQRDFRQKLNITYHNAMICPAVATIVDKLKQKYVF